MSGDEGPDYTVFRGTGGQAECAGLRRDKPLQAPNDDVVGSLEIGDLLRVVLRTNPTPVIVIVMEDGAEAGAIMPDEQLIACLQQGIAFAATVTAIRDGHIMLSIRPS
jgi:hypothetical protein